MLGQWSGPRYGSYHNSQPWLASVWRKTSPPLAAVEPWRGCVRRASVPSLTQTRQRGQRSLAKARQLLRNKSSVIRRKLIPSGC